MARTNAAAVQALLGANYNGTTDLSGFPIESATAMVDDLVTCVAEDGETLSATKLELIERWLSAWFYTKMDNTYTSKSTGKASASFTKDPETPEDYKAGALALDPTGCLASLLTPARAGGFWLGRNPSDQTNYRDRA